MQIVVFHEVVKNTIDFVFRHILVELAHLLQHRIGGKEFEDEPFALGLAPLIAKRGSIFIEDSFLIVLEQRSSFGGSTLQLSIVGLATLKPLCGRVDASSQRRIVAHIALSNLQSEQWVLRRLAHDAQHCSEFLGQHVLIVDTRHRGEFGNDFIVKHIAAVEYLGIDGLVIHYAIVEREIIARLLIVQCFEISDEFATLLIEFFGCHGIFLGRNYVRNAQSQSELVEHMAFGHLIGVHFEAERTQAHLFEAFLHHAERSHLFSHKKHAFALEKGIGYQVGDSLRLTRTRRAVKDKGVPHSCFENGSHLRRVDSHRQRQTVGAQFLVLILERSDEFIGLPSQPLLHKAANNRIIAHHLAMAVNVVPHQELIEGENAEHRLLLHIPSLLIAHGRAEDGKNLFHIHAVVVERQRIESGNGDIEILSQKFHKCHIEHNVLFACANVVHAFLVDHFYGQH